MTITTMTMIITTMAQAGKVAPRHCVPIFFILNDNNNDNNHDDNDNDNDGTSWEGSANIQFQWIPSETKNVVERV